MATTLPYLLGFAGTHFLWIGADKPWSGFTGTLMGRLRPDYNVDPLGLLIPEAATPSSLSCESETCLIVGTNRSFEPFGIFVGPDGNRLGGFVLPSYEVAPPAVAFDGNLYWVVSSGGRNSTINGFRVTRRGKVLDPKRVLIDASKVEFPVLPAIAAGDGKTLVAWTQYPPGTVLFDQLKIARLDGDGRVLAPGPVVLGPVRWEGSRVAYGGGQFLVLWPGTEALLAQRIAPDGALLDAMPLVVDRLNSQQVIYPDVAYDGEAFLVVWNPQQSNRVVAARLPVTGRAFGPARQIGTLANSSGQTMVRVQCGGGACLITALDAYVRAPEFGWTGRAFWIDGPCFNVTGRPGGTSVGPYREPGVTAAAAAHGAGYLVAWQDGRDDVPGSGDIYVTRVDETGAPLDPPGGVAVVRDMDAQSAPQVDSSGDMSLVVWEDRRGPKVSAFAARVQGGRVLDPGGFAIDPGRAMDQTSVRVAASETDFVVTWLIQGDMYMRRVSKDGLMSAVSAVAGGPYGPVTRPVMAYSGGRYLLAWEDLRRSPRGIYGTMVSRDGALLDGFGWALAASGQESEPALAGDGGGGFLLVWLDAPGLVHAMTLDINGAKASAEQVLTAPGGLGRDVSVAHDGQRYRVAWRSRSTQDILGMRISQEGGLLDLAPQVLVSMPGGASQGLPTLAGNGAGGGVLVFVRSPVGLGLHRADLLVLPQK